MTTLFIGGLFYFLLVLAVVLLPVFAIIDIMKHEFMGNNKLAWIIVIIFIPILGSILYFMIGERHKVY
jgi:hypothetical protein